MTAVLITGAASGIGAACAARYLDEGWRVIGWDREAGDDTRVEWHQLDVTDWEAVHLAAGELPALGAVVHSAGTGSRGAASELSQEEWDRVVAVNLSSVFYVSHATCEALKAGRGTLLALASVTASVGFVNRSVYSATKAAVVALMRNLAIEWAADGVRTVALSPTFTRTPLAQRGIDAGLTDEQSIYERTPQGRLLEPEEIATAIFRLAGPEFAGLTGSEVVLDAGLAAFGGF